MRFHHFLLASLFTLLATATTAQACGTYQTCNIVLIQDVRVIPEEVNAGEPVTIEIDTFEWANWYYSIETMLFEPQILVTIAGKQYPALPTYYSYSSPSMYGFWWYGMIWFTQHASFTHTFTWDGRDYKGDLVSGDQEAIIVVQAGAALDGRTVTIKVNGDVGKDDGEPCPKDPKPVSPMVGDPCNVTTGNTYMYERDYRSGDGELRFERSYNSRQADKDYGLGHGWIAVALRHLDVSELRILVRERDGRAEAIKKIDGVWVADADSEISFSETASGYELSRTDGTVEQYNLLGQLISSADVNGRVTSYLYDVEGNLSSMISPNGHSLGFSYQADGHLASVTDPAGGEISFSYDQRDNLSSVTYQDGSSRSYQYADPRFPSHLTSVTDERGIVTASYEYDEKGRAILTTHAQRADGQYHDAYTLEYVDEQHTRVTDGKGNTAEYTFDNNLGARIISSRIDLTDGLGVTQQFDARNNLISKTNAKGSTSQYEYSEFNQLIRKIEAAGTAEQRVTEYDYVSADVHLPTVVRTASVYVDGTVENVTDYDAQYRPVSIEQHGFEPDGSPIQEKVSLSYSASGNLKSIDGPREDVIDVTTFSYHECDTGNQCGQLASYTNALGHITQFLEYDVNGRLSLSRDPNGLETRYAYDARGRLVSTIRTPNSGATRETRYTHDKAGNMIAMVKPDGQQFIYQYDANKLLRSVTDSSGARIEYAYDVKGNRTVTDVIDPDGTLVRTVNYEYGLRDTLDVINTAGNITSIHYDAVGNPLETTNPNGYSRNSQFDTLNRMVSQLDALGGVSSYEYDEQDRLIRVTAPNSATTEYVYDDFGNLLQEISPDRGVTDYRYDQAGNIVEKTDARGVTVNYRYDALDRILVADFPGTESDIHYEYDSCRNGIGRLCSVSSSYGSTDYQYDEFGNRIEERSVIGGIEYFTQYSFDENDNIQSMTYPDGRQVNYYRDLKGRIESFDTTVNGISSVIASNVQYRSDGLITDLQLGNGITESRSYDFQGRLKEQTVAGAVWQYEHDANGNVTRKIQGSESSTYNYDSLDRLVEEVGAVANNIFSYDANGNRTAQLTSGMSTDLQYVPESNQLESVDGIPVSLDSGGNTIDDGAYQYIYNQAGRLSEVRQSGNVVATYQYNAFGQRVSKTNVTGTTHFHYAPGGRLIQETREDGQALRSYGWLDDYPLAQIDWRMGQGNGKANGIEKGKATPPGSENSWSEVVTWLHVDHLTTPRMGTNAVGGIVWEWGSDAFGSISPDEDVDGDGKSTTINLRFPGQYYDAETGKHYNYFRDYDPSIGRYIQSDPMGLNDGLNTYAYVKNRPITYKDVYGLYGVPAMTPEAYLRDLFNDWTDGGVDEFEKEVNGFAKKVGDCIQCEAECVVEMLIPGATDVAAIAANRAANKVASEGVKMAAKAIVKRVNVVVNVYDAAVTVNCVLKCD